MIQTRSGHKLVFDDTDGKEHIDIETKDGLLVSLDDEKKMILVSDDGKKNFIKIDSTNGTITIEAENKVVISAGSTVLRMEGSGSLSVSSDTSMKMKSSKITVDGDSTEVKAGGSLKLSSGGQASLKASVVKLN
jgi:uncharacterized protein (DUF2345 family)